MSVGNFIFYYSVELSLLIAEVSVSIAGAHGRAPLQFVETIKIGF